MESISIQRWTRNGLLSGVSNPFQSEIRLILDTELKARIERMTQLFLQAQEDFQRLRLPWKRGVFLYGPSGCGKSALSRGLAQNLGWSHRSIAAHQVLDCAMFEQALSDCTRSRPAVVVLEDIDEMLKRIEPYAFFTTLDFWMSQGEGVFWVATTRHPENTPKTQLVRPGRFEESIRLSLPGDALRQTVLEELLPRELTEHDSQFLGDAVRMTEGLSFSHLEEIRSLIARLRMEQTPAEQLTERLKDHIENQIIAGDRLGEQPSFSDPHMQIEERVRHVDPRLLLAAFEMTDVFKRLIEKSIADSFTKEQEKKTFEAMSGQA